MTDADPFNIENHVALVTGASRRIGAAIARRLHGAGMRIAIHFRETEAEAMALRDAINSDRDNSAAVFRADLIDSGEPARLIEEVAEPRLEDWLAQRPHDSYVAADGTRHFVGCYIGRDALYSHLTVDP